MPIAAQSLRTISGCDETPTLLVLERGAVVDRLEGRATGRQIDELIRPYLGLGRRSAA